MPIYKCITRNKTTNFADCTLFVPSLSVGNVGQLAVDLLISSFEMRKSGIIYHPAITGFIGPDPYELHSSNVSSACELYHSPEQSIAAIQIRSSFAKELICDFFAELRQFIADSRFEKVVILASCNAYENRNVTGMERGRCGDIVHFSNRRPDNGCESVRQLLNSLNVREIASNEYKTGSGYAFQLAECLQSICAVDCLMKYVSEGDNRSDAEDLTEISLRFHFEERAEANNNRNESTKTTAKTTTTPAPATTSFTMKHPISWQLLYGSSAPNILY